MKKKTGPECGYKPEHCEKLVAHMAGGKSFRSFGGVVRRGKTQLYEWLKLFPEFKEAHELGESMSLLHWETVLQQGVGRKDVNATLIIFALCNRFKDLYRQRSEQAVSYEAPEGKPVEELKTGIAKALADLERKSS